MRCCSAVLLAAAAAGCYAHQRPPEDTGARLRPPLVAPMAGRYQVIREGVEVGEERFTITSSAAVWRASGVGRFHGPAELRYGYVLEVDEETAEPVAFRLWLEMLDMRRSAVGRRDGEGFLVVDVRGVGGDGARRVPYARGTMIDSETSPLFKTLALSLLLPSLRRDVPVEVRAVWVSPPRFHPVVALERLVLRGAEDGLSRVEVRGRGSGAVALWVRPDGLPVKIRSYPAEGGAYTEMILQTE